MRDRGTDRFVRSQVANNRATADGWEPFAPHRQRVTELLRRAAPEADGRLCLLGAGNCNDVDLAALARAYGQITLADLDREAMAKGVARQGFEASALRLCRVDLRGDPARMAGWSAQTTMAPADVAALAAPAEIEALGGDYDVVASTCVLSQLVHGLAERVGEGHAQFAELVRALRTGHLRLLVSLSAAGGTAILVTDFASSLGAPELDAVSPSDLATLLARLMDGRRVFHGLDPRLVEATLRSDPELSRAVAAVEAPPPWIWDMGLRRYAVCAFLIRKRPAAG